MMILLVAVNNMTVVLEENCNDSALIVWEKHSETGLGAATWILLISRGKADIGEPQAVGGVLEHLMWD